VQRVRVRRFPGRLKKATGEPALNHLIADRPSLAMAVNLQVGVASSVGCMEKLGISREANQVTLRARRLGTSGCNGNESSRCDAISPATR
jgi:hypothetical protein